MHYFIVAEGKAYVSDKGPEWQKTKYQSLIDRDYESSSLTCFEVEIDTKTDVVPQFHKALEAHKCHSVQSILVC